MSHVHLLHPPPHPSLPQVHLREEVTKEQDIQKLGRAIEEDLSSLGGAVKASSAELEASLGQLEQYQGSIASLRQGILACEGELRTVSSPAYTARDRDRALAEQSVSNSRNLSQVTSCAVLSSPRLQGELLHG